MKVLPTFTILLSFFIEGSVSISLDELLLGKAVPIKEYDATHGTSLSSTLRVQKSTTHTAGESTLRNGTKNHNLVKEQKRKLSWYSQWTSSSSSTTSTSSSYNDDNTSNDDATSYYAAANDDNNDDGAEQQEEEEEEEKYYEFNDDIEDDYLKTDTYLFQGYSLKYGTCQRVQRFSSEAVKNGEYSSILTDDVVILRLCPKKSCSANTKYGCSSGYGEYVMSVSEYVRILMNYQNNKHKNLCYFCNQCYNGGYYKGDGDNGFTVGKQSDIHSRVYDSSTCYAYSNLCSAASCGVNNDDYGYGDQNSEIDYLAYTDYLGCARKQGYYWKPYCDSSSNQISMGIYYDSYCSQYAGDDVDISDFTDLDFDDRFKNLQNVDCLECAASNYPPYYTANNVLCNNVYVNSGKCDKYLAYSLESRNGDEQVYYSSNNGDDDGSEQQSSSSSSSKLEEVNCQYIESIRFGTYDDEGKFYVTKSQTSSSQEATVTPGQKNALIVISLVTIGLALYSCFLHHELTNMLLRSLSARSLTVDTHTHSRKRSKSRSRGKSKSRR